MLFEKMTGFQRVSLKMGHELGSALFFKIGLIVAFLLAGLPIQKAFGEDWVLFDISMDGRIEEYYDQKSVAVSAPGIFRLTTKTIKYVLGEGGARGKSLPGGPHGKEGLQLLAHTITRHQIECRNRSDTLLSTSDYDRDGRQVHHSEVPYVIPRNPHRRSPQDIYPESVSENLIRIVCPQNP